MTARFTIETLASEHDRTGFLSGVEPLDKYFREQVGQDVRRRVTACYVALEIATHRLAGYYTLTAGSISLTDVPEQLAKRLPHYQTVPVARLGRLAVHLDYRGQKLGGALLWDAMMRVLPIPKPRFSGWPQYRCQALSCDTSTNQTGDGKRHDSSRLTLAHFVFLQSTSSISLCRRSFSSRHTR